MCVFICSTKHIKVAVHSQKNRASAWGGNILPMYELNVRLVVHWPNRELGRRDNIQNAALWVVLRSDAYTATAESAYPYVKHTKIDQVCEETWALTRSLLYYPHSHESECPVGVKKKQFMNVRLALSLFFWSHVSHWYMRPQLQQRCHKICTWLGLWLFSLGLNAK